MKLSAIERLLVNNPVRAIVQRRVEAPRLISLGGRLDGLTALEIGCGRGVGIVTIIEVFGAARVAAVDLDEGMVADARRRTAQFGTRVEIVRRDATSLHYADATFDAVFSFGAIHHIPEWRKSVREIVRVLKPGGRFYFEEVRRRALERPLFKFLFEHPTDDRFEPDEFAEALSDSGLKLAAPMESLFSSDYFIGVAKKS